MEKRVGVVVLAVVTVSSLAWGATDDVYGIPLKRDPPFAVDADLSDWTSVPNPISVNRPEQVVLGAANWQDRADLSGTVRVAWRREHFFVAAEVSLGGWQD